jgi:hypothetical protein
MHEAQGSRRPQRGKSPMGARGRLSVSARTIPQFTKDLDFAVAVIKTTAKKPRLHRFRIDLGVWSVAVVIAIGGTRQERKALSDTKSEDRDS